MWQGLGLFISDCGIAIRKIVGALAAQPARNLAGRKNLGGMVARPIRLGKIVGHILECKDSDRSQAGAGFSGVGVVVAESRQQSRIIGRPSSHWRHNKGAPIRRFRSILIVGASRLPNNGQGLVRRLISTTGVWPPLRLGSSFPAFDRRRACWPVLPPAFLPHWPGPVQHFGRFPRIHEPCFPTPPARAGGAHTTDGSQSSRSVAGWVDVAHFLTLSVTRGYSRVVLSSVEQMSPTPLLYPLPGVSYRWAAERQDPDGSQPGLVCP